jgi:ABC-2 type transport system permease protein
MRIISLTKTFSKIIWRDKASVFWLVLFPLVLMAILIVIFSSFDNPETFSFKVVLLRNPGEHVQTIEEALKEISKSGNKEGKIIDLEIKNLEEKVLQSEVERLKESKINALVVVPADFDSQFEEWMQKLIRGSSSKPPEIKVYYLKERLSSKTTAEIIKAVIKHINNSLATYANVPLKEFSVKEEFLGSTKSIKYKDYLYPAIIIFSFLSISLFGITQRIVELRTEKVLKRVHLTPLKPFELFVSFNSSQVLLMIVEFALISLLAVWIFKVNVNPLEPALLSYSALSALTFISLAFMLASVIGNVQQATVIGNIILQVFQFLGGLYFDVFHLPVYLKWIVYLNPVTYLISGIRHELGILKTPYPYYLSYTVPIIWIVVSVLIASRYFRWVEER